MSSKNLNRLQNVIDKKPLGLNMDVIKSETDQSLAGQVQLKKKKESESFPLLGKEVVDSRHITKDDYFRFENKLRDIT
jgi:hypothetical protein